MMDPYDATIYGPGTDDAEARRIKRERDRVALARETLALENAYIRSGRAPPEPQRAPHRATAEDLADLANGGVYWLPVLTAFVLVVAAATAIYWGTR